MDNVAQVLGGLYAHDAGCRADVENAETVGGTLLRTPEDPILCLLTRSVASRAGPALVARWTSRSERRDNCPAVSSGWRSSGDY
eukprot:7525971-Pyramimonas_sp.AAC.1